MEIGVSTATLFNRKYNEDALTALQEINAKTCEVFLGTFQEYTEDFGKLLLSRKGNLNVHSIHTLNIHFEPQLFSVNPRAVDDAYQIYGNALKVANTLGAKYYTMHGVARFKRKPKPDNYRIIAKNFENIMEFSKNYNVELCLENVEWAYYNQVGFYTEISKYAKGLKTCLDIKQARISGDSYRDYVKEMGESIVTVHLSDVDESGKICLPGRGLFDFEDLFKRLKDVNFSGDMLIEVYYEDFNEISDIKTSLEFLRELKYKVF